VDLGKQSARTVLEEHRGTVKSANEDYPLVNLVRASTAAPAFFDPELLPISHNQALLPDAVAKPLKVSPARALYALLERLGLRQARRH